MEQKPFPFEVCAKCCNGGGDLIIDQSYNAESENAQSGKAVTEALLSKLDYKVGYENEIDNYKDIAQLYYIKANKDDLPVGSVPVMGGFMPYYLLVTNNRATGSDNCVQYKFNNAGILKRCWKQYLYHPETGEIYSDWTEWEKVVFESDVKKPFTINAIVDATVNGPVIEDVKITADKTFEEIMEAYNTGEEIRLIITGYEGLAGIITNICVFEDEIMFYGTQTDSNYQIWCAIDNKWGYVIRNNASKEELSTKEDISNKVTELTSESTDEQYPSAKAVAGAVFSKADKPLIVNVIEEDGNCSSAETFEEIYNAYRLEREVIAVVNSGYVVYRMVQINKNRVVFGALTSNVYTSIECNSSNIWKIYNIRFSDEDALIDALSNIEALALNKEDKPSIIVDKEATEYTINLSEKNNHIIRLGTLEKLSFITGFELPDDIPEDYGLDVSFYSGKTPTTIDTTRYSHAYWVGVDCTTDSIGISSFQPLANKHYDIVFYKNGTIIVGMVNGYNNPVVSGGIVGPPTT